MLEIEKSFQITNKKDLDKILQDFTFIKKIL